MSITPGSWKSPLSASALASAGISYTCTQAFSDEVWWDETRPNENGRVVVVSEKQGDLLPAPWSARTSIHEYGGRAWLGISYQNELALVFSEMTDQRLYLLQPGKSPLPLTPEPSSPRADRYGECIQVGNEIWCVREHVDGHHVDRDLIAIDLDGNGIRILESSSQFYLHPRVSPDGKHLAWICWEHPLMPWDGTELRVANIVNGELSNVKTLIGSADESVLSPEWADASTIYVQSDISGFWNPHAVKLDGSRSQLISETLEWVYPDWQTGFRHLQVTADGKILSRHGEPHNEKMVLLDPVSKSIKEIESPFTAFLPTYSTNGNFGYFVAGGSLSPRALIRVNLSTGEIGIIREVKVPIPSQYLPKPYPISLVGTQGRTVHAIVHPATNPDYSHSGPTPVIITAHGGPTSQANAVVKLSYTYFTSRGFAIVDVNYGGSTGYGRDYRNALRGQWGIMDYEDVVSVIDYLIEKDIARPDAIMIQGGSAGGYTVLNALVHSKKFAAGANYFGVASLIGLAEDTHDFESRYLDSMIGPYPERKDLYIERSPITYAENLTTPLIIFQGLDDKVVPPNQSEAFRDVCVAKGVKHKYFAFEGEGHGFTKASSIIACAEGELGFYAEVLGFTPSF